MGPILGHSEGMVSSTNKALMVPNFHTLIAEDKSLILEQKRLEFRLKQGGSSSQSAIEFLRDKSDSVLEQVVQKTSNESAHDPLHMDNLQHAEDNQDLSNDVLDMVTPLKYKTTAVTVQVPLKDHERSPKVRFHETTRMQEGSSAKIRDRSPTPAKKRWANMTDDDASETERDEVPPNPKLADLTDNFKLPPNVKMVEDSPSNLITIATIGNWAALDHTAPSIHSKSNTSPSQLRILIRKARKR